MNCPYEETLGHLIRKAMKPFLIGWCVCLVVLELYGAAFIGSNTPNKTFDFPSFYAAEYLARTDSAHLYELARQAQLQSTFASRRASLPFYHPSYEPFLLSPFSLLSYRSSYFVFIAFNMLLLMAASLAVRLTFSTTIPWWQPRPGLMLFVFVPLLSAVVLGQDSVLSLFLYCLTWRQLEKGKDASAGIFLALALFKFQIVLPIAALMAIWKGWRFTAGFLLTALGVVIVCIRIVGSAGTTAYLRLLLGAGSAIDRTLLAQERMGLFPLSMPNLSGLLYAGGGQFLHSPIAFDMISATSSLVIFVWCARIIRRTEPRVAFSIAILCGLLVSYHLFIYDLTLALLPVALLAGRINRYILLSLFGLPILLGRLGSNSFFILAVPILAMLANIVISTSEQSVTTPPEYAPSAN